MSEEQRNLMLALGLTLLIWIGFSYWNSPEPVPVDPNAPADTQLRDPSMDAEVITPSNALGDAGGLADGAVAPTLDRLAALSIDPRVAIETSKLQGSLSLKGAVIDDLVLRQYRETIDDDSPEIVLLRPRGSDGAYFIRFGWSATGTQVAVPGPDTVWQPVTAGPLTPDNPATLTWDNGAGLLFERRIEIDDNYMFTVTDTVRNSGTGDVVLNPYGAVIRYGTPETAGFYILHEGPLGVIGGTLEEIDYDDLQEEPEQRFSGTGGWVGITDKYWLAALVPDQERPFDAVYAYRKRTSDFYQAGLTTGAETVPAGGSVSSTTRVFAGAKVVHGIDYYENQLGIKGFDRSIDWGWFYFLTRPIFEAIHWLQAYIGNFGVAILVFTVFVKLLFFPLANKSYEAMGHMRELQPKMTAIREQYADDKQRQQQEMMELYKREKINPAAGCLPILIQIPVFFALYKVLFVSLEMRHAPFFGWVQDLSAPDPLLVTTLFGLIPWDPPGLLAIGIWPLLMGLSMWGQQKLNPAPPDPMQARLFMLMPIMFTFLLASFPVGLVIYWTWNNLLTIGQQWYIMRRVHQKKLARDGGAK